MISVIRTHLSKCLKFRPKDVQFSYCNFPQERASNIWGWNPRASYTFLLPFQHSRTGWIFHVIWLHLLDGPCDWPVFVWEDKHAFADHVSLIQTTTSHTSDWHFTRIGANSRIVRYRHTFALLQICSSPPVSWVIFVKIPAKPVKGESGQWGYGWSDWVTAVCLVTRLTSHTWRGSSSCIQCIPYNIHECPSLCSESPAGMNRDRVFAESVQGLSGSVTITSNVHK